MFSCLPCAAKKCCFTLNGPEDQSGFWFFPYLKSHSEWEASADAHIPENRLTQSSLILDFSC